MQTKNIFEKWGTEFTDMSGIFEQDVHELRKLLYERKMLVFHAPNWTKLEYWKFLSLWGSPWDKDAYIKSTERWDPIFDPSDNSVKYITMISNKLSKRLVDYKMPWHADIANQIDGRINLPHRSIYMKTVPNPKAGFTYWLDMEEAYPQLHPTLRKRWEARTVIQQNWHHPGKDVVEWPSMKQHPITGRWSPRCNYHGIADSWILDTKLDGKSMGTGIVEELMEAMAEIPECVYEHRWVPNDIVLYDNTPSVHRRTAPELKEGEERLMWRANVDHDISLKDEFTQ
jgi:alpha-ketoglutarate-dependent taurine dioxygenase